MSQNREVFFDKLITQYFDNLWKDRTYLDWVSQIMKTNLALRQQWNKNVEDWLSFWQLPNQKLQQRTLHQINTLVSEWRFEQDELKDRLERIERELAELKQSMPPTAPRKDGGKSRANSNSEPVA